MGKLALSCANVRAELKTTCDARLILVLQTASSETGVEIRRTKACFMPLIKFLHLPAL